LFLVFWAALKCGVPRRTQRAWRRDGNVEDMPD